MVYSSRQLLVPHMTWMVGIGIGGGIGGVRGQAGESEAG
jgi:hypothetical protein